MKANDKDVPEDEMLLAEAIAAAKSRGLQHVTGQSFRTDYIGGPLVACCALGAISLAGHLPEDEAIACAPHRHDLIGVTSGNDMDYEWGCGDLDLGESLGWAFRCAMTQEEP